MSDSDNALTADERAKLATFAVMRLILLNTQLVISKVEFPFSFYTEMDESEFKKYNIFLRMMHDLTIADLTPILPYIEYKPLSAGDEEDVTL